MQKEREHDAAEGDLFEKAHGKALEQKHRDIRAAVEEGSVPARERDDRQIVDGDENRGQSQKHALYRARQKRRGKSRMHGDQRHDRAHDDAHAAQSEQDRHFFFRKKQIAQPLRGK